MNKIKFFFLYYLKMLPNNVNSLKIFLFKFFISLKIIFHIFLYYFEKFFFSYFFKFSDWTFQLELRSISFIIIFSFLFYYFIVIELSILVFGYSLLCYRFLFILIVLLLFFSWWLEVWLIKRVIWENRQIPLQWWVDYYQDSTPLSLYDYLNNYDTKPLFKYAVVNRYRTEINDGRLMLLTFFIFLIMCFIYSCSYWFDPRFVKFVGKYFFPVINFFETWWNPWLEDFISATVWFWNWLVAMFENMQEPNSNYLELIKKIPKATPWLEDEANWQWGQKTSLWKNTWFSDIFYLRSVKLNTELDWIVFDVEPPTITANWFDPNWQLLFLRYLKSQFYTKNINFWNWYFKNDPFFWKLISNFSMETNTDFDRVRELNKKNFIDTNKYSFNLYDILFKENFFENSNLSTSDPFYEKFGTSQDLYNSIVNDPSIEKVYDPDIIWEVFTSTPMFTRAQTISELRDYSWNYKNLYYNKKMLKNKNEFSPRELWFSIFSKLNPTLWYSFFMKWNANFADSIPLYSFSNFEDFENYQNLHDNFLENFFTKPVSFDLFLELINNYNYWLMAIEDEVGLRERPFQVDENQPLDFLFLINQIEKRLIWIEHIFQKKGFLDFLSKSFSNYNGFKELKQKFTPFFFRKKISPSIWENDSWLKGKRKKNFYLTITPNELKQLLLLESKIVQLEWWFNFRDFTTDQLEINNNLTSNFYKYINSTLYVKIKNYFKMSYPYKDGNVQINNLYNDAMNNLQNNKFDFQVKNKLNEFKKWEIENQIFRNWAIYENLNLVNQNQTINPTQSFISPKIYPWYIWSLKYFGELDQHFLLPGFIRYYMPTPYPTSFSTTGFFWLKYQFFRNNVSSTISGLTDSIANFKNSTPLVLYSSVEAIMYVKPLFDFIDFIIKIIIKLITYPIEFIVRQEAFPINSMLTLAFFVHLIWFLHFYIYFFVSCYLFYNFVLYYNRKVGFLWFYERMFEENFYSQYTNQIYWHSLNDIWLNYRKPEQLYLFSLHTNLLLHYTFFKYEQYFYIKNKWIMPIINLLIKLSFEFSNLWNFDFFKKFITSSSFQKEKDNLIFWSFYFSKTKMYNFLLFSGGSDTSPDHLIWNYLDYLNQMSLFLGRSIWKKNTISSNFIQNKELNSLMKQFTILISSMSVSPQYFFMSTPILDTSNSWKIFLNLMHLISSNFKFITFPKEKKVLEYIYYIGFTFDLNLKFFNSSLSIYNLFENKKKYFLTKLGTDSFWDTNEYWFLVFFWSFRFVPKIQYPFANFHPSHEVNWLRLGRIAYANSWIGQSMYTWPFYNIVQHLWWTSRLRNWSFAVLNTPFIINNSGLSIVDNVRNFFEKWYNYSSNLKIETIFGCVWTLTLNTHWWLEGYGIVPSVNRNFDLSYPNYMIDKVTTNWGFQKTNPPLDLCELGFTPNYFINLFKNKNFFQLHIFLSFLDQLSYLDEKFEVLKWDLNLTFKKLNIYDGLNTKVEHLFYQHYEFYFKKFDYEFWKSFENPCSNWIFTFDISYFFSHFLSWDFFNFSASELRSSNFKIPSNPLFTSYELNKFFSNLDMHAKMTTSTDWFNKPFGSLDKFELQSIKKYKLIKDMDTNSMTRYWDDFFSNLDTEHTTTQIGLSSYPKSNEKTLAYSYSEEYAGNWLKWFPYNYSIVKNSTQPIVVGWVGEIYTNTITATSFMFSLLFASSETNILSWKNSNELQFYKLLSGGKNYYIHTFFMKNLFHKQLLSWSFTWLNLILHPTSYRYSFGPKALAWHDYMSWKCGLILDYQNGLYSYRPYLGYRHSFFNRITPYDPLYGFYSSYWQIYDNPLTIDLSTEALDYFRTQSEEEMLLEAVKLEKSTNPNYYSDTSDPVTMKTYALPYRELYYSFQHPYFIGYLLFWTMVFLSDNIYLGIINFSIKWNIIKQLLNSNDFNQTMINSFYFTWEKLENWYWRQMTKYRIFYSNPTYLISMLDLSIDEDTLQRSDDLRIIHNFYSYNSYLFTFLTKSFDLSYLDIVYLLNKKKIYLHPFLINWLTLDTPFPINPYIVQSFGFNSNTSLDFYQKNFFSFSRYDSLRENYNLNLLYDWSSGTYLDSINMISYISCFKGTTKLPTFLSDNQGLLATAVLWFSNDRSKGIALKLLKSTIVFDCHDLLLYSDLSLHNFSLLEFFHESIEFVLEYETIFLWKKTIFHFLNFYIKNSYFINYNKFNVSNLHEINSKISSLVIKKKAKPKQMFFLFGFVNFISYDLLINLLNTGLYFTNWKILYKFYTSFWFWLFTWYNTIQKFYFWIGFFLNKIFFKKF